MWHPKLKDAWQLMVAVKEGKAIPVTSSIGQYGSETLMLSDIF
jgi:hypothetical protein